MSTRTLRLGSRWIAAFDAARNGVMGKARYLIATIDQNVVWGPFAADTDIFIQVNACENASRPSWPFLL